MEIAGFLGRLVDGCKQRFVEEKRVLSFGQYLALFSQRPWLLGRNAPQYLKNTIDHFGRETVARPWGNVTRYRLFDAPFDRGRDRLIGQEEVQEQFYNLLAAFVKEGKASRLILLHGPNGSAKTTFVQCLARAMVHYSGTDDGAVYRFNWVFPKSSYLGKRVGFATGNAPSVPLEDQETFAFLDESEVAAVLPCGLSDHPVFLLPKADRMALLAELQRAEGFPADFRFSDHVTHGDLSPVSRRVFDALLSAYGGDLRRVLAHVQVERFYFSRRYRQGIVTVEPQMHVDAAVRQITMDESYANLPATLRHVNMIHLSGDLVDANRGLLEFSDLLKRPVDAFKYILGTCEASRISVDGTILYLDIVFVGTTNDKYLYAFAKMPDFPSFKGRMELACVPYLRDYRTEQQIYDLLVTPEVVGKHIAPHATWAAALFAVLTRLHKPSVDRVPTAAKSLVQGLTPLEKADLYALGRAPDSARFEAARELLESLPFLRNEGRGSPDYEGSTGASPREIKQVLLAAAQHPDYACLHPVCVLDELKELLKARSLYEFLQMEPNGDYHDAGTLLQRVRWRYIHTLDRELKVSMELVTDDE